MIIVIASFAVAAIAGGIAWGIDKHKRNKAQREDIDRLNDAIDESETELDQQRRRHNTAQQAHRDTQSERRQTQSTAEHLEAVIATKRVNNEDLRVRRTELETQVADKTVETVLSFD